MVLGVINDPSTIAFRILPIIGTPQNNWSNSRKWRLLWISEQPQHNNAAADLVVSRLGQQSQEQEQLQSMILSSSSVANPNIIPPIGSFRDTGPGEISIVSMNVLAPTYHALEHSLDKRDDMAEKDRRNRYPKAISTAISKNADILCLQEVEGGQPEFTELLKSCLLQQPQQQVDEEYGEKKRLRGYDAHVWSPLQPNSNSKQDPVGLCVAWRSDRHRLVSFEAFRRGMVVQLAEISNSTNTTSNGATIALANLHLPAKPSAIEGRLRTMASAIRRLQTCESVVATSSTGKKRRSYSALDGLAVVLGDFNCDSKAPVVKLLKTGYSLYGTLRDRNYKAKISKRAAANMQHMFRFKDVYDGDLRYDIAPITVSLQGRGPGCMDHMFYSAKGDDESRMFKASSSSSNANLAPFHSSGKRQARRVRGIQRKSMLRPDRETHAQVRLASVLATLELSRSGKSNSTLEIIENGLPNEAAGFYSDHLPVGALFEAVGVVSVDQTNNRGQEASVRTKAQGRVGVNERRGAYAQSLLMRRRHNKVLRFIAEWLLLECGATEVIRDVPLYKWKWITSDLRLAKKMRAPDLSCIVANTLVIVEVTVVSQKNAESAYKEKVGKYQDVLDALPKAATLKDTGICVASKTTAIVVLDDTGELYSRSMQDLETLSNRCSSDSDSGNAVCRRLCEEFRELVQTP